MSHFNYMLIKRYFVRDTENDVQPVENSESFEDTYALLRKLREENPLGSYTMLAEIDG